MKKQILFLFIFLASSTYCFSQCDKKIVLSSGGAERVTEKNEIEGTDERRTTIVYDSKVISITPGDYTLEGKVDSIQCDWLVPFKEGKTVVMATLTRPDGELMKTKLTIDGKDGKLIMLAEFDDPGANKLRFVLDKFEENK